LKQIVAEKRLTAFVHPVPPVLEPTRAIVNQFNDLLPMSLGVKTNPKWLRFADHLLEAQGRKLKKEYELDGTHLNPAYIPLLEHAISDATGN
jgi:hypothetical protein